MHDLAHQSTSGFANQQPAALLWAAQDTAVRDKLCESDRQRVQILAEPGRLQILQEIFDDIAKLCITYSADRETEKQISD